MVSVSIVLALVCAFLLGVIAGSGVEAIVRAK